MTEGLERLNRIEKQYEQYRWGHFVSIGAAISTLPLIRARKSFGVIPFVFGSLSHYYWLFADYQRERARNVAINYSLQIRVEDSLLLKGLYTERKVDF